MNDILTNPENLGEVRRQIANWLTSHDINATTLDSKTASDFVLDSEYTASDVLNKVKSLDGTGSGLDADLLDNQHGSYYQPKNIGVAEGSSVQYITSTTAYTLLTLWGTPTISHYNGFTWNSSSSIKGWQCTIAGDYHFEYGLYLYSMTSNWQIIIKKNNNATYVRYEDGRGAGTSQPTANPGKGFTLTLAVGDYINIWVRPNNSGCTVGGNAAWNWFECRRVY